MITKKLILLLVFFLPFFSLNAQQKPVYSLQKILQKIDSNNVLLSSYSLKAKALDYEADAATAWMPPMIGAGSYMTPYPFQNSHDNGSVMFRIEQEIANSKKLRAKKKYLSSLGNQETSNRSITYNELKAEAKEQYINWLIALEKIEVLDETAEILKTIEKIEEVRYPYNQSKLSNVYRAQAQIEKNEMEKLEPLNSIEVAKSVLTALMNEPPQFDFMIDTSYSPSAFIMQDTASLAAKRADIELLDQNIQSLQLNVEALKWDRKPTFSIVFDHMSPLSGSMPHSFSVMGMMSIPLASWSKKSFTSQIRAQESRLEALERERQATLLRARGSVASLTKAIGKSQQKVDALQHKVIPALQKTFDASFLNYQENKESLDVVLNNWEALLTMQLDILNEKQNLFELTAQYEKEMYQ